MKLNRKASLIALSAAILVIEAALPSQVLAGSTHSPVAQWNVQVDQIQPGNINIGPAFKVAIYENLVKELAKTKQFEKVLRYGDSNANGFPDLLILKTTVEEYKEGSETQRAVTTVSGFTKIKVRSQLYTRKGQIVLEHEFDGNVRFLGGSNLKATQNLAHNVAKAIKHSKLPEPTPSAS